MNALLELCESFLLLAVEAKENVIINSYVYGEGFREGKYRAYIDAHNKLLKALNQDIPEPLNVSVDAITAFAKTVGIDVKKSPDIDSEHYTTKYSMYQKDKYINGYMTLAEIRDHLMENYSYLKYEHNKHSYNPNSKH